MLNISQVRAELNNIKLEEAIKHSYRNFHAIGIDYINLIRTPELTAKIYIINPNQLFYDPEGFIIGPHDHRYPFETLVLKGKIDNVLFERGWGHRWHEYEHTSPLVSPQGDEYTGEQYLNYHFIRINEGQQYQQTPEKIHTLRVYGPTILYLRQYKTEKPGTLLFQREQKTPDLEDLYVPWEPYQFEDAVRKLCEL